MKGQEVIPEDLKQMRSFLPEYFVDDEVQAMKKSFDDYGQQTKVLLLEKASMREKEYDWHEIEKSR